MERYSDKAAEIINALHTERLEYNSEYLPLIEAATRLAAYEDTGLEPEEIVKMGMAWENSKRYSGRLEGKLKAYETAKQEGRLVVLPCKVGDVLWTYANDPHKYIYPFTVRGIRLMEKEISTDRVGTVKWDDIGKTVFLTREEAEAAQC